MKLAFAGLFVAVAFTSLTSGAHADALDRDGCEAILVDLPASSDDTVVIALDRPASEWLSEYELADQDLVVAVANPHIQKWLRQWVDDGARAKRRLHPSLLERITRSDPPPFPGEEESLENDIAMGRYAQVALDRRALLIQGNHPLRDGLMIAIHQNVRALSAVSLAETP